jgi:TolA-binding protein
MVLWISLGMCVAADQVPYAQRLVQALGFMQQGAWQQAVEAVGELHRKATLTPELARLWFVRGILAQKLQDPDTAQQAFERVWQGYPPLADYAAWEMVQYDAARDFLPTLQKTVTTLGERYPFSRLLPESQLVLARAQHRSGQSAAARATLERLVRDAARRFLGEKIGGDCSVGTTVVAGLKGATFSSPKGDAEPTRDCRLRSISGGR